MLWKMAWQFTRKQWKRNLLVVGAVATSVFVMVFLSGMLAGVKNQFEERVVREGGHLRLHAAGWSQQTDALALQPALKDPEILLARLKTVPGVQGAEEFLPFAGMLLNGDKSFFLEADGVEPQGFAARGVRESMTNGVFSVEGRSIVLSKEVSNLLGLTIGAAVTLLTQDSWDMPSYRELTVSGLYDTRNSAQDDRAFVSLPTAKALTGLGTDGLEIRVLADQPKDADHLRTQVARIFPQKTVEIQTWSEFQGSFLIFVKLFDVFMLGINGFLVIVAAMVITNALLMNFLERLPVMAALRAIGMRQSGTLGLALREGAILGGLGTMVGTIVGCISVSMLSAQGLDLGQAGAALGVGAKLPFALEGYLVLECAAAGIVTVLSAALYSGVAGARTPILDGLVEA